jgi:hypothetical protein
MVQNEGLVIALLSWALALPLSMPMSVALEQAFGRIMMKTPVNLIPEVTGVVQWLGALSSCPSFRVRGQLFVRRASGLQKPLPSNSERREAERVRRTAHVRRNGYGVRRTCGGTGTAYRVRAAERVRRTARVRRNAYGVRRTCGGTGTAYGARAAERVRRELPRKPFLGLEAAVAAFVVTQGADQAKQQSPQARQKREARFDHVSGKNVDSRQVPGHAFTH